MSHSAAQAGALIAAVGGIRPGLLTGYRVKILDGNGLAGREHRLAETRSQTAAPLPGKALQDRGHRQRAGVRTAGID
ncbi:MAG: hypothetical protein WBQ37_15475 [Candidatus Competibacter sp.]